MLDAPLRIGISLSSFNNVAPYRLIPPACAVEWVSGDPSDLTSLMARGELDACLLPTGAFATLEDSVRPLGPYGIGSKGHVLSVRLFSGSAAQLALHALAMEPASAGELAEIRALIEKKGQA